MQVPSFGWRKIPQKDQVPVARSVDSALLPKQTIAETLAPHVMRKQLVYGPRPVLR
jgi:hypothetical protein